MSKNKSVFHWSHLIWVAVVIGAAYLFLQVWRVEQISCLVDGQHRSDICQQLSPLKHKSLFFYNLDRSILFEEVLKNEKGQSFQVVQVQKKLPNQLVIEFKQQNPSYRLLVGDKVYLANQQNFVTENDEHFKNLVLVEMAEQYHQQVNPPKIEQRLNQTVIDLISVMEQYQLPAAVIKVSADESVVKIDDGWSYRFDFDSFNPEILVQQVKLINSELDEQDFASAVKQVDLRFKLPVVKTEDFEQELESVNTATSAAEEAEAEAEIETATSAGQES